MAFYIMFEYTTKVTPQHNHMAEMVFAYRQKGRAQMIEPIYYSSTGFTSIK